MPGIAVRRLDAEDPRRLGDYRLLWRLASGGMGRIYLARPAAGGPLVAVKTLLAEGPVERLDRERFAREVDLARRVDAAYTARVLDADPGAPRPWMAIQYVPAPSLADLVREQGPLAAWAVPSVAAGVVQALMSLHGSGVVHRDVKPQNTLLPLSGPLLIDFGISHAVDRTRTSLTLGTVAFTSPEQARGEASTEASDVFSLGATLFHLAVGRPPYREVESSMVLLAHVQGGKLDLTGLPAGLAPLIEPCLAFDPRRRPDLATVLATAVSAPRRGRRWLPVEWTATITAYEAHGRALDADRTATGSAPGGAVAGHAPPRMPVLTDPGEAAVRQERQRRAEEARRRREAELRRLARNAGAGGAGGSGGAGGAGGAGGSSGTAGWAAAAVLLAVALLVWQPWTLTQGTSADARGTSSAAVTPGSTPTGPRLPSERPTPTRTPTSTPSQEAKTDSGTSDAVRPTPTPTPTPTRDRTEEAFLAVRQGSCLPLYATGYPDKWNVDVPPGPVRCDTDQAHVQVTSVTNGDCPGGNGRTYWRYKTTNLCLTRIFHVGYCVLGKGPGNGVELGTFTLVDCKATRIPAAYDYVLHITGVYRAPANASAANCRRSQNDSTDYRAWLVNDNSVLLCTMFYRNA
ncbi:serine/threonine-protein kinase [Streptomyces sp. NRRL F-2747]|uniref:serine/threonine-protein kinase n=1 Tax=Streptomyces sp. NRRL F-2747 TaxID=1463843 RepID=UPI0006925C3E|nr:serine/threonine-protein kinase [Streptomyces sp. NRRL F-2747]